MAHTVNYMNDQTDLMQQAVQYVEDHPISERTAVPADDSEEPAEE